MNKLVLKILFFLLIFLPVNSEEKVKSIIDGNLDAKVNIIVFESLTCSHCANFHKDIFPKLKKQYIDQGLVSIEFKSFPLDLAAFNASKIAHCKNDGDSKILHYLFLNQDDWVKGETIDQLNINLKTIVNKQNFDIDFNECLSNKKIEDHILEDRINGVKKFEVNATPTIIINDKKFEKSLNYKNLKKSLEKLI